jgi:molecular chaperone DnaK
MVKDAEAHAAEDKKRRELVEARNQAESLIHTTEKTLAELGDKVSGSDKSVVETAITDLKSALEVDDTDAIKAKSEALAQASMKLGEQLYKSQAEGSDSGDQGGGTPEDDVVDADFEEVDDDDKKSA